MVASSMAIGLDLLPTPPLGLNRVLVYVARLSRLDSVWIPDRWQGPIPTAMWGQTFSWAATLCESPTSCSTTRSSWAPSPHGEGQTSHRGRGHGSHSPPPGTHCPGDADAGSPDQAPPDPRYRGRGTREHRALRAGLLRAGRPVGGGPPDHPVVLLAPGTHRLSRKILPMGGAGWAEALCVLAPDELGGV